MERRRLVAILFIAAGVLILVLLAVSLARNRNRPQEQNSARSVVSTLPDAEMSDMPESKSEAITVGRSGRNPNIEAYYDSCEVALNPEGERNEDPMKSIGGPSGTATSDRSKSRTSEDLFGKGPAASGAGSPRGESYRETPAQREARHQRRREEAIDMVQELSGGKTSPQPTTPSEPDRIDLSTPETHATRQSGVISSLSGTGGGVSSLAKPAGTFSADSDHPFRCVFPRGEKIKSGQKVAVRLLEDMIVGSYLIPKNTHLQAYVTIDSRLELEISSIELGGNILPLGCVAYDTDGMKGIYCPEAGDVKKTIKTSGLGTVGSLLGGRVGRVAGEVVNTGVSLAQSASGERTVTVPAGYNFFIVRKKQP